MPEFFRYNGSKKRMPINATTTSQRVAIVGCGWLGLPLAKQLTQSGFQIVGTVRSTSKIETLKKQGVECLPLELGKLQSNTLKTLTNCDTWVLNIPSGRRTVDPDVFAKQMIELITYAKDCAVEHLIFISTTSVYGEQEGRINENSTLKPKTSSAIAHQKIEQFIKSNLRSTSTILRLAGLVDNERHPIYFLANKKDISAPNQAVNLVHKQDVCDAIERLICLGPQSKPLHLSATEHPSRKDYYQWAAEQLRLVKPEFARETNKEFKAKQIDATDTLSRLKLSLKYPSPYQMLGRKM